MFFLQKSNFFQPTKSPHFPLRQKVSQLSKRKRAGFDGLSWLLIYGSAYLKDAPAYFCGHLRAYLAVDTGQEYHYKAGPPHVWSADWNVVRHAFVDLLIVISKEINILEKCWQL